jgi:Tripartite tricarboxylate transporter family receptor
VKGGSNETSPPQTISASGRRRCRANILAVSPSVPAKNVPELIAYAQANPGRVNMASAGIGTKGHLAGELFQMMAGVNVVHVPYRGNAPALSDLLGGQVEFMFASAPSTIEYVKTGKLRALAVTTTKRTLMFRPGGTLPKPSRCWPAWHASSSPTSLTRAASPRSWKLSFLAIAVPVQPLLEGASRPYSMFKDYWKYDWVLPVCRYEGLEPSIW